MKLYAKILVSWLVSSDTARLWHQETISPTSIQGLEVSDKLPVAKDVIDTIDGESNRECFCIHAIIYFIQICRENWAKYVAGVETRDSFLRYQQIFKDLKMAFTAKSQSCMRGRKMNKFYIARAEEIKAES